MRHDVILCQNERWRYTVELYRANFASALLDARASLSGNDLLTLKLYYTAAMLLQKKYNSQLTPLLGQQKALPDLFSTELAGREAAQVAWRRGSER
jgi:hypothetical protein